MAIVFHNIGYKKQGDIIYFKNNLSQPCVVDQIVFNGEKALNGFENNSGKTLVVYHLADYKEKNDFDTHTLKPVFYTQFYSNIVEINK